nr:unnamed protein product [Digitaria exilis]
MLGSHGTAPWPDGVWGPRPDDSPSSRLRRRPLLAPLPATNGSARDPARARVVAGNKEMRWMAWPLASRRAVWGMRRGWGA